MKSELFYDTQVEKGYFWFFLGLLIFSFFYQLGIYPLFHEEPRRALIALEMLQNENLWVPTQTGDLYYRKPPMYNWLIILSYKMFGQTEWAVRLFSVLSHLILAMVTFFFAKQHTTNRFALIAAIVYVLSVDILLYFSALGEIDLFYALVTSSSIFAIYHWGERQQYLKLFLIVYSLTAIGFLAKGLSSLPYTAISLLVYFTWKRKFKVLLNWRHFVGIAVLLILLFVYFYQYSLHAPVEGWWSTLYSESAQKAAGEGFSKWLIHLVIFPFDILKNLLPGTFFLTFLYKADLKIIFKKYPLVCFALLIFIFNVLVYWISAEGRSRYIYPLFPMASIFLSAFLLETHHPNREKYLNLIGRGLMFVTVISFLILPFISRLSVVDHLWFTSAIGGALAIISLVFSFRQKLSGLMLICGALVLFKFAFSSLVPQTRQKSSGAADDKRVAIEMAEITQGESLYLFNDLRISLSIVFYLERERGVPLTKTTRMGEDYYLISVNDIEQFDSEVETLKRFDYRNEEIYLIRPK